MKAWLKYSLGVVFILLSFSNSLFGQISNFSVDPNTGGGGIKISWTSESESGFDHYEIYRRAGYSGSFICVRDNISRLGDYRNYTIIDYSDLFKTEGTLFQYKVRVVYVNGSIWENPSPISTSYNSSTSVGKRTWGSIKAMFR
jgi:hypothetical protein